MSRLQKLAVFELVVVALSILAVDVLLLVGERLWWGGIGIGMLVALSVMPWLFRREAQSKPDEREHAIQKAAALSAHGLVWVLFLVLFFAAVYGTGRIPSMPSYTVMYFGWACVCVLNAGYAVSVLCLSQLSPTIQRSRILFALTLLLVVVCVLPSFALVARHIPRITCAGHQQDEWVITSPERITVHSRINLTRWPSDGSPMHIQLPYEQGTVESVSYYGTTNTLAAGKIVSCAYPDRALGFERAGAGQYTVALPKASGRGGLLHPLHSTLHVVWQLPVRALEPEPDSRQGAYRVRLKGLIPLSAYVLKVVLQPGCGFEMLEGTHTENIPFSGVWGDSLRQDLGSCALCVRRQGA